MSENDTEPTSESESTSESTSESAPEPAEPSSIGDEQLPADLVASDDNPLAEGLPVGDDVHVREEGKRAEQMPDPQDEDEDEDSSSEG